MQVLYILRSIYLVPSKSTSGPINPPLLDTLIDFMEASLSLIKRNVCSLAWKLWKNTNGVTKQQFKLYRRKSLFSSHVKSST